MFDQEQAKALRGVLGVAHPYKAVLPNRWTKPDVRKGNDPAIYPKPSIEIMDAKLLTNPVPGLVAGDHVESPEPGPKDSGPNDAPKESFPHIYELCLNEIQIIDYPGVYKGFKGIEQNVQRAMRIPYLFYKDTGKGSALLVKDYVTVLYEGGAGH